MDPISLAHQATDILAPALPFIYAEREVVTAKVHDMLLEKGIEKLGSKSLNKAKVVFDKIRSKKSKPIEIALEKLSKNSEDTIAKEELQQGILKLLSEDRDLARKIDLTINLNVENINHLALGNYNTFFNIETPSGDEYIKIIEYLDERRKEAENQEIMHRYNSSALPAYPERLKEFVTNNRADELRKALTYLEKHKILLISGIGGVGKTTLARALVDLRPINVLEPFWFSFYDNQGAKLGDILAELAAYMRAPEITEFKSDRREPGKNDVDKFTGVLNDRSEIWLFFDDLSIILENTKFNDKGIELLFSSLRYRTHNAKIIITSRVLPNFKNGESLIDVVEEEEKQHLNGLRTDFAVDYLAKNGLDSLTLDELKILAKDVDGHLLALKLLVGLVKKFGVSDTLNDLTRYRDLKESTIKKTRKMFDKLAGNEKELLERISVYRRAETMNAIKIMFTDKTPIDAVDNLIDKSLLETDHKGRYWLQNQVEKFSYIDLKNKKEVHKLAMEYYCFLITDELGEKEYNDLASEAFYHANMAEEYDQADNILHENPYFEVDYDTILKYIYSLVEQFAKNPFIREVEDEIHAAIFWSTAMAYRDSGESRKAIEKYEKALKIYQEIGQRRNEGDTLGYLGIAYNDLGESRKAIECHEKALKIAQELGYRRKEVNNLGYLGKAYNNLGEPRKAVECYEKALKIAQEHGEQELINSCKRQLEELKNEKNTKKH
jgi:tetratricopeptide (TPR) repeat protein